MLFSEQEVAVLAHAWFSRYATSRRRRLILIISRGHGVLFTRRFYIFSYADATTLYSSTPNGASSAWFPIPAMFGTMPTPPRQHAEAYFESS